MVNQRSGIEAKTGRDGMGWDEGRIILAICDNDARSTLISLFLVEIYSWASPIPTQPFPSAMAFQLYALHSRRIAKYLLDAHRPGMKQGADG